ncbi:hypothetical protein BGX26_006444 [Mortierella sp. AD094]|nr:hypothetical protein BGX26_006444 [Mortierella sp. AD094]
MTLPGNIRFAARNIKRVFNLRDSTLQVDIGYPVLQKCSRLMDVAVPCLDLTELLEDQVWALDEVESEGKKKDTLITPAWAAIRLKKLKIPCLRLLSHENGYDLDKDLLAPFKNLETLQIGNNRFSYEHSPPLSR